MQATSLQRVTHLAHVVRSEKYQRRCLGDHRPNFRYRDLKRRQNFQEEGFEFPRPTYRSRRLARRHRGLPAGLSTGSWFQELFGKEQVTEATQPLHSLIHAFGAFQHVTDLVF